MTFRFVGLLGLTICMIACTKIQTFPSQGRVECDLSVAGSSGSHRSILASAKPYTPGDIDSGFELCYRWVDAIFRVVSETTEEVWIAHELAENPGATLNELKADARELPFFYRIEVL